VVTTDDNQGDSNSLDVPSNHILQNLQQTNQHHVEEVERITQQLSLHRQQWEQALQTSQQQQQQQQAEAVQQRLQQLDQDSHQQIRDIRQQMQQQINKIIIDFQELNEQAQHSQQQLLKQMSENAKVRQKQDRLSPKLRGQETQQTLNQFIHAQYLVQAVLANPSHTSPAPRLFIILPGPIHAVDRQGESLSVQFRLYFLCECGSHTMAKDCTKPHEVHLANHPGYDLNNQDQFISKYGPYLLTMMYMVKYGTKARGLVVPPLLGLNHAIGDSEGICQLIDDTITYLKEATGCVNDATVHQCLDIAELTDLKWHLKTKVRENVSGGLSRMQIQDGLYTWICSDHLRECYESALQQLRYSINASGGVWSGNEIKVTVTPEATTKQFYELGRLFKIQSVESWRPITEIGSKLHSYRSASSSTTDTLGSLDGLQSLSLDFGRFTMSAKGIFQDEIKDVVISIRDLGALTLDDLEFIQQCPAALVLSETPQQKDDNRLVSLLQHNSSITSLRIVCDVKRHIAIIDLVSSTREEMLQDEIRSALRTFELVHPETRTKVSFDEGSPALDTVPHINLGDCQSYIVEPDVYNSIRQHGWSAITFVAPESFSDRLAILLDESLQETTSRIARLDIAPASLSTPGLDAMSRVINQSQGLTCLQLSLQRLDEGDQLEKALLLLERHKERLTSLHLNGQNAQQWLPRIAQTFPDKSSFPVLEEFFLRSYWWPVVSAIECRWIASMVSIHQQPRTPLKVFSVSDDWFFGYDWKPVIQAIDFSTMEELHFNALSFRQKHLELLVDRIADSGESLLPLRVLGLSGTFIKDNDTERRMSARVREKAPNAEIRWL
jgi:hypothetical protein